MARPISDEKERFSKFIQSVSSGCIEWQSTLSKGRYGKFYFRGRQELAHRAAWILSGREIPEGRWVLHHCDNRKCVNPDHLYLGDAKKNAEDREQRRTGNRGAKYSAEIIAECKLLYSDDWRQVDIAKKLGMTQQSVSRFVRGIYSPR